MGFSFGATGLQGEACPVPAADGIVPFTFKPETHDAWCDCMYSSSPGLNALCKIKFGENLPNGDLYLDPSMPWTVTGKRTRGLTNDALGKLLQGIMQAAGKAVVGLENQVSDATGVDLTGGSTHPAGPAGPVSVGQSNQQTASDLFRTAATQQQTLARSQRTIAQGLGPVVDPGGWSMPAMPSSNTILYGLLAVGAAWYFLRPKARVTLSGFGGYNKRRRRARRSRR